MHPRLPRSGKRLVAGVTTLRPSGRDRVPVGTALRPPGRDLVSVPPPFARAGETSVPGGTQLRPSGRALVPGANLSRPDGRKLLPGATSSRPPVWRPLRGAKDVRRRISRSCVRQKSSEIPRDATIDAQNPIFLRRRPSCRGKCRSRRGEPHLRRPKTRSPRGDDVHPPRKCRSRRGNHIAPARDPFSARRRRCPPPKLSFARRRAAFSALQDPFSARRRRVGPRKCRPRAGGRLPRCAAPASGRRSGQGAAPKGAATEISASRLRSIPADGLREGSAALRTEARFVNRLDPAAVARIQPEQPELRRLQGGKPNRGRFAAQPQVGETAKHHRGRTRRADRARPRRSRLGRRDRSPPAAARHRARPHRRFGGGSGFVRLRQGPGPDLALAGHRVDGTPGHDRRAALRQGRGRGERFGAAFRADPQARARRFAGGIEPHARRCRGRAAPAASACQTASKPPGSPAVTTASTRAATPAADQMGKIPLPASAPASWPSTPQGSPAASTADEDLQSAFGALRQQQDPVAGSRESSRRKKGLVMRQRSGA